MTPDDLFAQTKLGDEILLWAGTSEGEKWLPSVLRKGWLTGLAMFFVLEAYLTLGALRKALEYQGAFSSEFVLLSFLLFAILALAYFTAKSLFIRREAGVLLQLVTDRRIIVADSSGNEIRIISGRPFRDVNATRHHGAYRIYAEPLIETKEDGLVLHNITQPRRVVQLISTHFMVAKEANE